MPLGAGDRTKNRKLIFIGGKGAVIGGLIGERLTKGEEAEVKSGTEFGIYLNQAVSLPKFAESNFSNND